MCVCVSCAPAWPYAFTQIVCMLHACKVPSWAASFFELLTGISMASVVEWEGQHV